MSAMLNLWLAVTTILFTVSPFAHGYDPLDPNGEMIIKWDLLHSSPGHHTVLVKIENKQEYRHVEKPGWKLSWHWVNKTVIWDMRGAETTEQGNCLAFASSETLPHCCLRRPTIVDLLPGAPFNMQVSNCCRGGVLTSMSQDPINHVSAFQMTLGSFPDDPGEFIMPYDFDIGVPGYTCGNATSVAPTKYITDKGRRKTQALATWEAECMYSQTKSSQSPKCCVSLSAFYYQNIVPCPTCSCGCPSSNCVKSGVVPSLLEQEHDPHEEASPVVQCTKHMCPIHIHWHVKVNYKKYWRVKITATNLNTMKNYSDWNLVVLHPNLSNVTKVFSFNYKPMTPYSKHINDTGVFWGLKYYNDVLIQAGETGNVQTEILLNKDMENFSFKNGWGFPRRILFNGDECVMPSPDEYPRLPRSASYSSRDSSFVTSVLCFLLLLV
ncbi:COBRA-like protein 6 [Raphanus sativus]|uniref:COBRA-like protein n=1 Tax=Raphanus sativus TaxID=3726 RepID=A0A6J0JBT1_RAPSA|nr:COBRA-like protein 6 [Raphanus sativus]KAJ4879087.1 COBRA-like protein 6 [Raphanus sativus]